MIIIIIKEINSKEAEVIIENREPLGKFYLLENGRYVGIDNEQAEAWTEDFDDKEGCFNWLCGTN